MRIYHLNPCATRPVNVLLSLLFLGLFDAANAQIYKVNSLSGANEPVPNSSPATGNAVVTIENTTMRVQLMFSGLQTVTTVAHIHAATSVPGEGSAGVATPTPSFPGFPAGVTNGTYDATFDMTLTSSYNATYLTANGGTPAAAFVALKTSLNNGTAYINIHTTSYPAGEIRGFFQPETYQNLSSMLTFNNLAEAISTGLPGDTIQQINNATEMAPIELPLGLVFDFPSPFTFAVNIP